MSFKSLISTLADSSFYTKRGILIVADTIMLTFALWASSALRLEQFWPAMMYEFFLLFITVPLVSLPVFVRLGMYRAVIRYTSLDALWVIFVASFCSSLLMVALLLINGLTGFPRSVPFLYFTLSFLFLGGSRLAFRNIYAQYYSAKNAGKRVIIYGAGSSGRQMVTAFRDSSDFNPVCFVDNAKELQGRDLAGLPIYAPEHIERLLEKYRIDMILLAMPAATRKRKKEILRFLEPLPVVVKSLPSLDDLVSNDISIKDIQDIQIEDLLGRDPVPPRLELIHSCILDKVVMVTGAGGSIGSELCRQIAANNPRRLVLYERSEFALYTIESEMRAQFGDSLEVISILGSVTHKRRVLAVIKALSIQTIYHAAAYKHVPLVEYNPIEGVQNNVFGTLKTAEAAIESGVETFVLISTDKAVRPANVMGASKRMAELILQAFADKGAKTRFIMVRFGNVLGSSGSVVPHFREQIKNGGPVTVTHADVVRYFMTIPEAVQLVIQAGAMGTGGDVFVLDMGEPVRIIELARNLIHLCGFTVRDSANPNGDITIEFTGLRPGEKLFEELLVGDNVVGTIHPMIMRAEEQMIPWKQLAPAVTVLDQACRNFDYEKVRATLLETVEGYSPQCTIIDPVWKSMEEKIGKEARKTPMRLLFKKI
ncbi:MAG: nucleoside-diphosphate sugar epimerase/dehydratase [Desulfobulbaceae bacterium]